MNSECYRRGKDDLEKFDSRIQGSGDFVDQIIKEAAAEDAARYLGVSTSAVSKMLKAI